MNLCNYRLSSEQLYLCFYFQVVAFMLVKYVACLEQSHVLNFVRIGVHESRILWDFPYATETD